MSAIVDHARSMLAYNRWANQRILDTAAKLSAEDFASVSDVLAHVVGTQFHWYANWTGETELNPGTGLPLQEVRELFERSHGQLQQIAESLTDEEWQRAEAWWQRFGIDARAPMGMTLFQVIYHGVQHRAEVAMMLTEHGCSPGDLDYLIYLQELAGVSR